MDSIEKLDTLIMLFVQNNLRCSFLNVVMKFFSVIGNVGAVWLAAAVVFLLIKKHRRTGVDLLLSIGVCWSINDLLIKNLVARPRPFYAIGELQVLVALPASFSFPSGHTCSSFAAAYVLTRHYHRWGALSYIPASLIALSRIYVGVHYPSDVLAGAIVGTVGGVLVYALSTRLGKSRKKPDPSVG